MKLGLVPSLNTLPLEYGFRLLAKTDTSINIIEAPPSELYLRLSRGELSAALISSVEVLRNHNRFGWCQTVGVCANKTVRSIIYICRKKNGLSEKDFFLYPPRRLITDSGSRTSATLLRLLLRQSGQIDASSESKPPEMIPDALREDEGGLLIGDAALSFLESEKRHSFFIKDLAEWWHEKMNLPFVFALWAYPIENPLPDSVFEESLAEGIRHLDEIVRTSPFYSTREYLTENLHYRLTQNDRYSLNRFNEELAKTGLL